MLVCLHVCMIVCKCAGLFPSCALIHARVQLSCSNEKHQKQLCPQRFYKVKVDSDSTVRISELQAPAIPHGAVARQMSAFCEVG